MPSGSMMSTETIDIGVPSAVTVTVTDEEDIYATATFTVVEEVITIETNSESYEPGDTISFTIESTVEFLTAYGEYEILMVIADPDGSTFWNVAWDMIDDPGNGYYVPYSGQLDGTEHLTLPSDADQGTWNWTATYQLVADTDIEVTGTFTVGELVAAQLIIDVLETVYKYDIVTVTVTADGTPISIVSVDIIDPDGISYARITTALGTCAFTADTIGMWSVLASKTGYIDADPVFVEVLERIPATEYSIELVEGWNLISLPLIPGDSSIEVILADVIANVEVVWHYDANPGWSMYDPDTPGISDLTEMVDGKGYLVDMTAADTLIIDGTEMPTDPLAPMPSYPVIPGWNMIGYKETYSMEASDYLSGIEYSVIYEFVDAYVRLDSDDLMIPGKGYLLAVVESGTIYP